MEGGGGELDPLVSMEERALINPEKIKR